MESRQFCSVCKEWLEMEIVDTSDGDDDGVVWFRCPQCQGFLPKLRTAGDPGPSAQAAVDGAASASEIAPAGAPPARDRDPDDETDSDLDEDRDSEAEELLDDEEDESEPQGEDSSEPVAEYAAMLAEVDPGQAVPYRPWGSYEVGQCLHHLAWDDCGVVVAKENLPGGRQVVKVYFEEAGVVRLIEKAPR